MCKVIEPEVAGGFGEQAILDTSVHPPIVKNFHFEFAGWLGDDILENFPCFMVTQSLKDKIESENLTGITFANVLITRSFNFNELYPDRQMPEFYWAKITGDATNDFFLGKDHRLVISEKAYELLKRFNIGNATVEDLL